MERVGKRTQPLHSALDPLGFLLKHACRERSIWSNPRTFVLRSTPRGVELAERLARFIMAFIDGAFVAAHKERK